MKTLADFLASSLAEKIGLTLLHSIWQLTLVAVIVFLVLRCLRRSSPNVRYVVSGGALLLMVVIPALTFSYIQDGDSARSPMAEVVRPLLSEASELTISSPVEQFKPEEGEVRIFAVPARLGPSPSVDSLPPSQAPVVSEAVPEAKIVIVVDTDMPTEKAPEDISENLSVVEDVRRWLLPWSPWLTVSWLVGFVVVTVRNVGGWQATRRLRRLSGVTSHPRAHSLLRDLSEKLGIGKEVQLRECELVQTPIVFGWLKPVVLTPIGLLTHLTNAQLEALLAHELGHVHRHDYFFNGLQTLAESLLFFHPAVWLLSRRIRLEREYCCDDIAVKLCGDQVVYAETLATIEESRGTVGLGLAAGEKPLLKRVRRVLGLNPKPRNQLSLFGVLGGSLLVAVSLGFVLVSSGQDLDGKGEKGEEVSESNKEEEVVKESPERVATGYERLSKLENEIKRFLKSGQVDEAERRILEELPAISESWLSEGYISLLNAGARSLREEIGEEPELLSNLVKKILSLEQEEATTAAMLDIVGAEEEARSLYGKVLASDPDASAVIRLHQVRLLGAVDPGQLTGLLSGKTNPRKIRDAISSAFRATGSFEQSIAFMNALSEYLEQVDIGPEDRFDWVSQLSYAFGSSDWRGNRLFGDYQLPPVWEPNAPHDNQMIGKVSNAALVAVRRQAYERYCRASLRIPDQAAWGFSQLGALADLKGDFDSNPELVGQAQKALNASGKPTVMGLFVSTKKSPRFFSPELYLAYSRWKEEDVDLSELTEAVVAQIERLENLLSAQPSDFGPLAQALMENGSLKEVRTYYGSDGIGVMEESDTTIAARRLHDVMLIWNERQNDADIGSLILRWTEKGKDAAHSSVIAKVLVNCLRVIAYANEPALLSSLLEELTTIYLGPPPERNRALESLPDIDTRVSWGSEPLAVKYLAILKLMVEEPALIFPALEKASELGLLERMRIHEWIQASDFRAIPEEVISRLERSPLVADLAEFRVFPRSSGLYFPSNYPKEVTLLDWVAAEIGALDGEGQRLFIDYLEGKKTFGSKVMLALLSEQSEAILATLLKTHASEVSELSDEAKTELATFMIPKLPKDAAEVRGLFVEVLGDENEVQLQKFKESLMAEEGNSSRGRGNEPGEVFMRLYQQDRELALRALRVAQSAQETGGRKIALFSHDGRWFRESIASDLLERINFGMDPPQQGRSGTEFYLQVLADEQLGPHLIINPRLLTPKFSDAKTVSQRLDSLKNALVWIAEVYPENLAKEYFFIATIERGGWLSVQAQQSAKSAKYQQDVLAALPPSFRPLAEAALELGSVSDWWVSRDLVTPRWHEPKVAAAFEVVAELLGNESLPLNLRVAVAASVCENCRIQTDPKVALQCAEVLAEAWSAKIPVGESQGDDILRIFSFQEESEPYLEVALRLTEAWKERVAQRELETGEEVRDSDEDIWIAGLLAGLNDETSFTEAMNDRFRELSGYEALQLLPLLVRAGKAEEAAQLVKRSAADLGKRTSSDQRTYYDQEIEKHLPTLLKEIEDSEERILVEAHLSGLGNWPFASGLSTREERLVGIAKRACEMEFQGGQIRNAVYRLLFQERATAKFLAKGFFEMAGLERLETIVKTSERYGWVRLAEEMIHCVLSAGEVEKAMEVLEVVEEKSQGGDRKYKTVWEAMSKGVSGAVSTNQNDPALLEKMLPATRFIAASSADWGLSDRDRVGDYARNIFCHAKLNQMGAWREWREGLEPEMGKELDAIWFPKNGRMIWLVASRTPKDTPLEERLAVMKNILSEPQVVGSSGKLHDDAIEMLRSEGYFSEEEFLEVEEELVEVMID